ncbi:MAG: hypothetical protein E6Q95_02055 [Chitinophagaceae bacterium]|nr:MAG: hypothetical protein E6Q95_02055 [Chitinophagaceae bacterium]
MKRVFASIFLCSLMVACGSNNQEKKADASNEDVKKEIADFFGPLNTVYNFSEDSLDTYKNDASNVDITLFKQYVSDSMMHLKADQTIKKVYGIGRIDKGAETFYIAKLKLSNSNQLIVFVLDKAKKCVASLTLLDDSKLKKVSEIIEIDGKNNFNKLLSKKVGNTVIEGKEMYAYDEKLHQFVLVLKDSLGDEDQGFINPIDTLAQTNKFAGDYTHDQNVLSIRDSKKKDFVEFVLYINEKENGCKGELRGEAVIKDDKIIEYNKPGDPCVLQMIFHKNTIKLSEVKGCGSRLGDLNCSFNSEFRKKKSK